MNTEETSNGSPAHGSVMSVMSAPSCGISFGFKLRTTQNNRTSSVHLLKAFYEGWNFNSGNYLFTTDTK